jgi:hypothetical protein
VLSGFGPVWDAQKPTQDVVFPSPASIAASPFTQTHSPAHPRQVDSPFPKRRCDEMAVDRNSADRRTEVLSAMRRGFGNRDRSPHQSRLTVATIPLNDPARFAVPVYPALFLMALVPLVVCVRYMRTRTSAA